MSKQPMLNPKFARLSFSCRYRFQVGRHGKAIKDYNRIVKTNVWKAVENSLQDRAMLLFKFGVDRIPYMTITKLLNWD